MRNSLETELDFIYFLNQLVDRVLLGEEFGNSLHLTNLVHPALVF